jgi:GNAT superfamily N-acetyltransferase
VTTADRLEGIALRRATEADLPDCERIWRDGLNEYLRRLNQVEIPADNPGLRRLHAHTLATDPDRFLVAVREERVVAFGSAVRRGDVAFLSMLFVDPAEQARGLGRRILAEILPSPANGSAGASGDAPILATVTDSAQPISNGLYASLGMIPRVPLLNLVGRPRAGWQPPALPDGVLALPLTGERARDEVAALDREVVGYDHEIDHRFVMSERPSAFAYRDAAGALVAYGYTSAVGRIGPIAVRDVRLMAPVLGHLLTAVEPRGASAIWLAGDTSAAVGLALDAGLRFEDFPLLLCWSRPFADFERYVLISPGLP